MFNKSYEETANECAVLNTKLRLHTGGHLNVLAKQAVAKIKQPFNAAGQGNYLNLIVAIICTIIGISLILKLFSK
nr:hypothetical protein [Pedobacter sp. ASV2]